MRFVAVFVASVLMFVTFSVPVSHGSRRGSVNDARRNRTGEGWDAPMFVGLPR